MLSAGTQHCHPIKISLNQRRRWLACLLVGATTILAGCATPPEAPSKPEPRIAPPALAQPEAVTPMPQTPPPQAVLPATEALPPGAILPPASVTPTPPTEPIKTPIQAMDWLKPSAWSALPGWKTDDLSLAWPALLQSCSTLQNQSAWQAVCGTASQMGLPDTAEARAYFERQFQLFQVIQADSSQEGMVTGYYEPLLRGSRSFSAQYRFPLYSPPDDLLVVDLASIYPELKSLRLRGRLDGNKVVPYFTRSDIEAGKAPIQGREIAWVDDPVELFFLQIQGSGRIQLDNGEVMRVGYADANGHPYRSIGKWLVEQGELTLDKASMQGIKDWGRRNPERLPELLATNPSYVFFRELPSLGGGPLGSLGVPLTAERSIAVDPRVIPLGAPVWLATTRPNSPEPLNRLVLAQDTGGAIKGNVRADFFWGFGDEAGQKAGAMKQKGRMWLLLPKDYPLAPSR